MTSTAFSAILICVRVSPHGRRAVTGTHRTQRAYAPVTLSLSRTRKLPSLPALANNSSAAARLRSRVVPGQRHVPRGSSRQHCAAARCHVQEINHKIKEEEKKNHKSTKKKKKKLKCQQVKSRNKFTQKVTRGHVKVASGRSRGAPHREGGDTPENAPRASITVRPEERRSRWRPRSLSTRTSGGERPNPEHRHKPRPQTDTGGGQKEEPPETEQPPPPRTPENTATPSGLPEQLHRGKTATPGASREWQGSGAGVPQVAVIRCRGPTGGRDQVLMSHRWQGSGVRVSQVVGIRWAGADVPQVAVIRCGGPTGGRDQVRGSHRWQGSGAGVPQVAGISAYEGTWLSAYERTWLSAYERTWLSAYERTWLSAYERTWLSAYERTWLSAYERTWLSAYERTWLSAYERTWLSAYDRVWLSAYERTWLSAYERTWLSAYERTWLSAYDWFGEGELRHPIPDVSEILQVAAVHLQLIFPGRLDVLQEMGGPGEEHIVCQDHGPLLQQSHLLQQLQVSQVAALPVVHEDEVQLLHPVLVLQLRDDVIGRPNQELHLQAGRGTERGAVSGGINHTSAPMCHHRCPHCPDRNPPY
ncbi:unnamed protein product [Ranitomeya imitator]|uniref:Uncharacterized protein n=1 Tax=Ranitomeya imitator TaxID=111125 RepID=A0ABN9MHX8_9NEOB|nr:unnamed protein product [Ranitomeya imitator]